MNSPKLLPKKSIQNFSISLFAAILIQLLSASQATASSQPYITGHNINFGTGNKYQVETDISLPGPGQSLTFKRTYNSTSDVDTTMGYGWSNSFGEYLIINGSAITRVLSTGRHIGYTSEGTDSWVKQIGKKDTIITISDGYQLTRSNNTIHTYDSQGRLTQTTDINSNSRTYTYTGDLLSSISDNFGHTLLLVYNTDNRLETLTTPIGDYTYAYDANNNLASVIKPDSSERQYIYDDPNDLHNLTGIFDEENVRILTVGYDTLDRAISSSVAGGTEGVTIEYQPDLQRTITDSLSNISTYQLEVKSGVIRVKSLTGPGCSSCGGDGANSSYVYNDEQLITSITNGHGVVMKNFYDDRGNRISTIEAAGTEQERTIIYTYEPDSSRLSTTTRESVANQGQSKVTSMTYDAIGNIDSRTESGFRYTTAISRSVNYDYDPMGRITFIDGPRTDVNDTVTYTYYPNTIDQGSNRGNLHTITNGLGHVVTYSDYNIFGSPKLIDSPNGFLAMTYDTMGRLITRSQNGISSTNRYDLTGTLTSIDLPGSRIISYDYTPAGKLERITDTMGNSITYSYDSAGNRSGEDVHDSDNVLRRYALFEYDETGRMDKTTLADGSVQTMDYDDVGNLVSRVNAVSQTTSYGYDALDRLTSMTEPGNVMTGYAYDLHDNLMSVTDAKSHTSFFDYDDFGFKMSSMSPDTYNTTYDYDPAGNLIVMTDAMYNVFGIHYDALNRPKELYLSDIGDAQTFTYDQGEYGVGHLSSFTDQSGATAYSYNAFGKIASETRTMGDTVLTTEYGYDAETAELNSMTYPSGLLIGYQRDANGSVSGLTANGQPLLQEGTHLPFGPLKGYTFGDNQQTIIKNYDQRYNLTAIQGGGLDYQYSHDLAGRVKSISGVLQPYITAGSNNITYQEDSNHINVQTGTTPKEYILDANGNTISDGTHIFHYDALNRMTSVEQEGLTTAEYAYDAHNHRVKKIVSGTTTLFQYDLSGNLIAETTEEGSLLRDYIYFNGQPFALMVHETSEAGFYFFINDHLGTPQHLVTSTGQSVWQAAYFPFGEAQVIVETVTNNLRFPGQYYDVETGLHYNWHRYYDPETGRYISADPIGLDGGINLYAYVLNDPVNNVDPTGLYCGSGLIGDLAVPDYPFGFNYSYACKYHDDCYGRCGVSKSACDRTFRRLMRRECNSKYVGQKLRSCLRVAQSYYNAVKNRGQSAYDNAQKNCKCTP